MAMTSNLDQFLQRRQVVLQEMQSIDRLRRGSLSQQFFRSRSDPSARLGPYFVLQGFLRGKKFCQRIPEAQAAQVQADVDNHRRFQSLAEEYVTLSDQITCLQDRPQESKKNFSRKRSPTNVSRKPRLS
jgi:hypothetical protein